MSKLPRSTSEIQGYVYDARVRAARLARTFWNDPALADRLERDAADLKARFNRDFWLPDRQAFALAIDGDGRKVDALTSNIGHLLWSGIADPDHAAACVAHLMGDGLFSGGAFARWLKAKADTTRSATTSARCGRTTTASSPLA